MAEADSPFIKIGDHKEPLEKFVEGAGRKNSAVWCRNIDELRGFLTYGRIDLEISEADAGRVVKRLIEKGMAEEIIGKDGKQLGWNIHHNEEASPEPEAK
jgi:hypothetical protein